MNTGMKQCSLDGNEGTNQCIIMLEWKIYAQIHAVQSYQKEVNDKYLESSDIQHTSPGRVTSIFELGT